MLLALHPAGGRPRGDGWARCVDAARRDRALARPTACASRRFASCSSARAS